MNLNDAYKKYVINQAIDPKEALNDLASEIRSFAHSKASRRKVIDADMIAQEVTMRVIHTLARFDSKRGNFRGWVATYTINYMNTCHRAAKRRPAPDQETEDNPLQDYSPTYMDDHPPYRDESELPPEMQTIVALLTLGYTKREISERTKVSVRTIERRIEQHIHGKQAA